jgi:hypothetical protein
MNTAIGTAVPESIPIIGIKFSITIIYFINVTQT